jgi:hypothetical protein
VSNGVVLLSCLAGVAGAQETLEERVNRLEAENAELNRKVDLLAEAQEDFDLTGLVPAMGDSEHGLGPAASKVYSVDEGVSLGGYGEAIYQNYAGSKADSADFLRAILYVGYRFDENWVFNSEYEFEHASTGEEGETSVEFATLDYLHRPEVNFRAGLVLSPMGFLNELHEPQTYLGATRPEVERRIIPSTWREIGAGVFGEAGPISYRAYLIGGFDGIDFTDAGLRGGRQKGSKIRAEDIAVVARADWTDTPGVLVGGSVYHGDSGQDRAGLGATTTTIVEAHAEYRSRGWWARGLVAHASVDDVTELNAVRFAADPMLTLADSVGEEMNGGYLEVGYDVWSCLVPDGKAAVRPYCRYEWVDTQADVPTGFVSDPLNDFDILTVGLNVQPIDRLVFKIDYQDFERSPDRLNVSMGYAF